VEILAQVEEQVALACRGVAERVKEKQTATGIKDAYTQYWIDELINRARKIKMDEPNRTIESIQQELLQWVATHKDEVYNGFLTLEGGLQYLF
jgi:hypothetical protein